MNTDDDGWAPMSARNVEGGVHGFRVRRCATTRNDDPSWLRPEHREAFVRVEDVALDVVDDLGLAARARSSRRRGTPSSETPAGRRPRSAAVVSSRQRVELARARARRSAPGRRRCRDRGSGASRVRNACDQLDERPAPRATGCPRGARGRARRCRSSARGFGPGGSTGSGRPRRSDARSQPRLAMTLQP